MSYPCQSPGCINTKTNQCGKCKQLGLSTCFGRYCSKECQEVSFSTHKLIHTVFKSAGNSLYQIPETITLALKESEFKNRLPLLNETLVLSILLIGCKDDVEGTVDYSRLFKLLSSVVYPNLQGLELTLCGPMVTNTPSRTQAGGKIKITQRNGLMETLYPTIGSLSVFSCAVVMQPGLSDFLPSWTPAMQLLVESNLLTITSGYSAINRWTFDALFDESVLSKHFGAQIIVPRTRNPTAEPNYRDIAKNAFYVVFQGRAEEATPLLSYAEIVNQNRIVFLQYIGDEALNHEDNPDLHEVCVAMIDELRSGKLKLNVNISNADLERMANQRA
jgi:hypothetical protein